MPLFQIHSGLGFLLMVNLGEKRMEVKIDLPGDVFPCFAGFVYEFRIHFCVAFGGVRRATVLPMQRSALPCPLLPALPTHGY